MFSENHLIKRFTDVNYFSKYFQKALHYILNITNYAKLETKQ